MLNFLKKLFGVYEAPKQEAAPAASYKVEVQEIAPVLVAEPVVEAKPAEAAPVEAKKPAKKPKAAARTAKPKAAADAKPKAPRAKKAKQ